MSTLTRWTDPRADDRSTIDGGSAGPRGRTRNRAALVATFMVFAWSIMEFIDLGLKHTTGPELYGVLVAAVTVATGALTLALLASSRRRVWLSAALLVLWAVIALGGVAGTVAHIIGPVAGHGPVDLRPRPIAAPLVFTILGLVGGVALFLGQRTAVGRGHSQEKE